MKTKNLIVILGFISILCICATLIILFGNNPDTGIKPDYKLPNKQEGTIDVPGDGTTLDKPEGGGAISVQFKDVIYVDLSENKITLDYTHPQKSHNNIVLKLTIQSTDKTQDIEIFRTGYLEPRITESI